MAALASTGRAVDGLSGTFKGVGATAFWRCSSLSLAMRSLMLLPCDVPTERERRLVRAGSAFCLKAAEGSALREGAGDL